MSAEETRPAHRSIREKFNRIGGSGRVWAVASIHGEAGNLARLHDRLWSHWRQDDRIVYLGNFFGRGAAICETVDELLGFRRALLARPGTFVCDVTFLRGSQEEIWQKLLQLQFASNPKQVLEWMLAQGLEATLAAYGGDSREGFVACRDGALAITRWTSRLRAAFNAVPGHTQFLSALQRAAFTEDGSLLFVHAGVDPARPLDAQGDAFWWSGTRLIEMTEPFAGFRRVIRGNDRNHGGLIEGSYATSIDGGCGFGGELLAVAFQRDGTIDEYVTG